MKLWLMMVKKIIFINQFIWCHCLPHFIQKLCLLKEKKFLLHFIFHIEIKKLPQNCKFGEMSMNNFLISVVAALFTHYFKYKGTIVLGSLILKIKFFLTCNLEKSKVSFSFHSMRNFLNLKHTTSMV